MTEEEVMEQTARDVVGAAFRLGAMSMQKEVLDVLEERVTEAQFAEANDVDGEKRKVMGARVREATAALDAVRVMDLPEGP